MGLARDVWSGGKRGWRGSGLEPAARPPGSPAFAICTRLIRMATLHLNTPATGCSVTKARGISRASNYIWALVSGLPSGPRERRLMMVMRPEQPYQAWIDDSG